MIHLRGRTGAVGHHDCGLTCSPARTVSLSLLCRSIMPLPLRKSRQCKARHQKDAFGRGRGQARRMLNRTEERGMRREAGRREKK
jgi:hypothetical protein